MDVANDQTLHVMLLAAVFQINVVLKSEFLKG